MVIVDTLVVSVHTAGVAVGDTVGVAVAVGVGVAVDVGVGVAVGETVAVGDAVGVGLEAGEAVGEGDGDGLGDAPGDGDGSGLTPPPVPLSVGCGTDASAKISRSNVTSPDPETFTAADPGRVLVNTTLVSVGIRPRQSKLTDRGMLIVTLLSVEKFWVVTVPLPLKSIVTA